MKIITFSKMFGVFRDRKVGVNKARMKALCIEEVFHVYAQLNFFSISSNPFPVVLSRSPPY
jgi:hypothetical protein